MNTKMDENVSPLDINLDDDGDPADEVMQTTHWSADEKTLLFECILGPNSDNIFELLKFAPKAAFEKLSVANFKVFEGYTENGDDDEDDPPDDDRNFFTNLEKKQQPSKLSRSAIDANLLENQTTNAKAVGHDVGRLSAKVINEWYTRGWFELFSIRYGKSLRTVVSMAPMDEFSKLKDELEQQRFEAQQERFAREEERAELLSKIELARAVLSASSIEIDPDVKAAANRLLYRFFNT
jgi:hypothetical protein